MLHIRLFTVVGAFAVTSLIFAASALSWSQYYEQGVTCYSANHSKQSDFNQSLALNQVYFDEWLGCGSGGLPQMGTRYVKSDGTTTYSWMWSNTGSIYDYRTIGYGAAQCKANSGNGRQVEVDDCFTQN